MAKSPEELAAEQAKGLLSLEGELWKSEREITTTLEEQKGQNWRTAAKAVSSWEAARRSGESKGMMDALVELTKLPLAQSPVDMNTIQRIEDKVRATLPGVREDDRTFRRMMWQTFAEEFRTPEVNPNTLGTFQYIQDNYTWEDDFITERDAVWDKYQRITQMADIQSQHVERASAVREQALGLYEKTQGNPEELQQYLNQFPLLGDSATMNEIERFARDKADVATQATGETKETLDAIRERRKQLQSGEAKGETERDMIARIIAKPGVQWWAEQNGFELGKVIPAEEGKDYPNGVKTPVGIYIPGPDDTEALKFADKQMARRADQDFWPWQHRRLRGERPVYGQVEVKRGSVSDASFEVDGSYYFQEADGKRKYYTPQEIADLRHAAKEQGVSDREAYQALGVQVAKEGPTKDTTQVVTGKMLAPRYGDPVGTVRMSTRDGEVVFKPEDIVGEPLVTAGGGEPQTVGRFIEVLKGRVATNREEKYREEGGPKPVAENLAATIAPDRYGRGDRQKAEDARYAGEMARRREQEAVELVEDTTGTPAAATRFEIDKQREAGEGTVVLDEGGIGARAQQQDMDAFGQRARAVLENDPEVKRERFRTRVQERKTAEEQPKVDALQKEYDTQEEKSRAVDAVNLSPVPDASKLRAPAAPTRESDQRVAALKERKGLQGEVAPVPTPARPAPPKAPAQGSRQTAEEREQAKPPRLNPIDLDEDEDAAAAQETPAQQSAARETLVTPTGRTEQRALAAKRYARAGV